MSTKAQKQEQAEAIEHLKQLVKPGDTVYTVLRHVSRSGMMRLIDCYIIADQKPLWITSYVAKAIDYRQDYKTSALKVSGCGMDMGFHVVYILSSVLFREGFGCIGRNEQDYSHSCPSNDHSNGDRDYTRHCDGNHTDECVGCGTGHNHWHTSGGYALRHEWM